MVFRGDFGRELTDARPMYVCHACGYDFREAARSEAVFPNVELLQIFDGTLLSLEEPLEEAGRFDLGFYAVTHQFCRLMVSKQNSGRLQGFIAERLGVPSLLPSPRRICFEQLRRGERHQFLLCALWLMADIQHRLEAAWGAKAVRYNLMLKDMEEVPAWYKSLVGKFSGWRRGAIRPSS